MPSGHSILSSDVLISWSSALARYSFPSVFIFLPWELPDCFWHLFLCLHLLTQRQWSFGSLAMPPSAADPSLLPYFVLRVPTKQHCQRATYWLAVCVPGKICIFSSNQISLLCSGKEVHCLTSEACFNRFLLQKESSRVAEFVDSVCTPFYVHWNCLLRSQSWFPRSHACWCWAFITSSLAFSYRFPRRWQKWSLWFLWYQLLYSTLYPFQSLSVHII